MIENILTFLSDASAENVNLFLVKKSGSTPTEISYNIFKPTITSEIGGDILRSINSQLREINHSSPEYINYDILPHYDGHCVEIIRANEVPNLSILNANILSRQYSEFSGFISSRFLGYIVKIHSDEMTFYGFNKSTPAKVLNRGKLSVLVDGNLFNRLNSDLITIETNIAAATLLQNNCLMDSEIFVFNKSQFESFFSFKEEYHRIIDSTAGTIDRLNIFDNSSMFIENSKTDMRVARKFARIIQNGFLERFNLDRINSIVESFGLNNYISSDGKLIVTRENMWVILRILDDDYLRSDATDEKYESHSKRRR